MHNGALVVCLVEEYVDGLFTVVVVGGSHEEFGITAIHATGLVVCLRIICILVRPTYTKRAHLCARE